MSDNIFYLFSAILLGLVIGALIMYFATGSSKNSDKTIAKLEKELAEYKDNVAEHFEQTADLVDGMTESYKKVFDHLGKSARNLMTEDQIQKQLEARKGNKVTLEYLTTDEEHVVHDNETTVSDSVEEVIEELAETESTITAPEQSIVTEELETEELETAENTIEELTDKDKVEKDSVEQEIEEIAKEVELKKLEKEVELREKNIYS